MKWNLIVLLLSFFFSTGLLAKEANTEENTSNARKNTVISEVVGYDRGFFIQSPDEKSKLKITGYFHSLLEGQKNESAPDTNTFRVRRARLKFVGNVFTPDLAYVVEYDFSGSKLLAGYIRYFCGDTVLTAGQFRVPFNLEAMSSASTLQFVDRSIAHQTFGYKDEREPGFQIASKAINKKVTYTLGVFNGEGLNTMNANNEFRYATRIDVNILGRHKYDFGDSKQSEKVSLLIGVATNFNDTPDARGTSEEKILGVTGDISTKYKGFSFHGAGFFRHTNPDAGPTLKEQGFLAQVGYFIVPTKWEIAARTSRVYLDGANDQSEYTGGLNYHIFGSHRVKLQLDYSLLQVENGIAPGNNAFAHRGRAQLQMKF